MPITTVAGESVWSEMEWSHCVERFQRIERLQGIVCDLLRHNEELRAEVRELKELLVQSQVREEEQG